MKFIFLFIVVFLVSCGMPLSQPTNLYINERERTFHIGMENKIQMNQWFGRAIPSGFVSLEETPSPGYCRYQYVSSDVEIDSFGVPFFNNPSESLLRKGFRY